MKDRYDIFGSLPDTIDDDWIEDIERLEEMMDRYMHLRQNARDAFEIRYEQPVDPDGDRWATLFPCARSPGHCRETVHAVVSPTAPQADINASSKTAAASHGPAVADHGHTRTLRQVGVNRLIHPAARAMEQAPAHRLTVAKDLGQVASTDCACCGVAPCEA